MKHKTETQQEAVKAILNGELLLEEAMEKYQVKSPRTILAWIKKHSPAINAVQEATPATATKSQSPSNTTTQNSPLGTEELFSETKLLKKIISLQEKVYQLEKLNAHLLQQWGQLLEKIDIKDLQID